MDSLAWCSTEKANQHCILRPTTEPLSVIVTGLQMPETPFGAYYQTTKKKLFLNFQHKQG